MMFIVRSVGRPPEAPAIAIKVSRPTPAIVPGGSGTTDFFCVGDPAALAVLREAGHNVIELRDGYYEIGQGGGVAIWGQGRYWEIRSDPFTVVEAVTPTVDAHATPGEGEHVEVRRAIFGG